MAAVSPQRAPLWWAAVACAALGVISLAVLPSVPGYDPFAWIVWGREIAHQVVSPHATFVLRAGPSWKPLPIVFTTIFGALPHSVALWVAFDRAGGLLGLFVAYRLGARLAASERWPAAGPLAGVLAAVAIALTAEWARFMLRTTSEPLTITAALLWVDRHLAGRRLAAFAAGFALALMRPEAAALLALYAVWLLWRGPGVGRRLVVLAGLVVIPVAWIVPPWVAVGQPFQASHNARAYHGNAGLDVASTVLHRATSLTTWPVIAAAAIAVAFAIWRRDRVVLALAAASVAYVGVVELMSIHGYPGLARFMLPAAAIVCVLGATAVARLATFAGGGGRSLAAGAVLVAVAAPAFAGSVRSASTESHQAQIAQASYNAVVGAAHRAGPARALLPCPTSDVAVNHTVQTSLAWALDVPLNRVRGVTVADRSMHHPALAFFAPRNEVVGGAPRRLLHGLRARYVTRNRMWRVLRITRRRDARVDRCVGDSARAAFAADRARITGRGWRELARSTGSPLRGLDRGRGRERWRGRRHDRRWHDRRRDEHRRRPGTRLARPAERVDAAAHRARTRRI